MRAVIVRDDLILSRRDLDFLVFDCLAAEALAQRRRYAGQDRSLYEETLDLYQRLAAEQFATHNKKCDCTEPQFDGKCVRIMPEVSDALGGIFGCRTLRDRSAATMAWHGITEPHQSPLFAVPRRIVAEDGSIGERNDVVAAGINHKVGYRGIVNCVINFDEGTFYPPGAAGAIGYLVGEPGRGLAYMFQMMKESRINVGLGAAALAYTG